MIIAEQALDDGIPLHIALPFAEEDFIRCCVLPWGEGWLPRYHACRARCASFRVILPEPYLGDEQVYALGSAYAMGLAIRHADSIRAAAMQICVWDGQPATGVSGTARDHDTWLATGLPQTIVPFPGHLRRAPRMVAMRHRLAAARQPRAILFCDVQGFSRLAEYQVPVFFEKILGGLAEALRHTGIPADHTEAWGDSLYLAYGDVVAAADAALTLLDAFRAMPFVALGLPNQLTLRIAGHYGPLTPQTNPFTGVLGYVGGHNVIAARIEPIVMPGSFFVSEAFSAMLALSGHGRFHSEYVGMTALAKFFGNMRLFAVTRH